MGANQSAKAGGIPVEPTEPRAAWESESNLPAATAGGGRVVSLPLPEWGAEVGNLPSAADDSDSDVEHDRRTLGSSGRAVEPHDSGVGTGLVRAPLVQPVVEESTPAWAANGGADEPCSSLLELQFVYGYRGADCRRNAFFLPSGEVAFHAATLVVIYDPRQHRQRFLRGHESDVRCLALHPRGSTLASGQAAGGSSELCLWQVRLSPHPPPPPHPTTPHPTPTTLPPARPPPTPPPSPPRSNPRNPPPC